LSWLQATAPEAGEIRGLLDLCPDGYESLSAVYRAAWSFVDPVILELCRLRLAQLLGCQTDLRVRYEPAVAAGLRQEKLARLERWPHAPDFSARERACLEFAEQFLVDARGITDAQAERVLAHLSAPEFFAFVNALGVFEQFQRFCLAFGIPPRVEDGRVIPVAEPLLR
jgi:alkylhydroperoxidase family enzyme